MTVANDIRLLHQEAVTTKKLNVTRLKELEKEQVAINSIDTKFEYEAIFVKLEHGGFGWNAEFLWPAPPKPIAVFTIIDDDPRIKEWFELKAGQKVKFKGTFGTYGTDHLIVMQITLNQ